jgi:hypothetical protein
MLAEAKKNFFRGTWLGLRVVTLVNAAVFCSQTSQVLPGRNAHPCKGGRPPQAPDLRPKILYEKTARFLTQIPHGVKHFSSVGKSPIKLITSDILQLTNFFNGHSASLLMRILPI